MQSGGFEPGLVRFLFAACLLWLALASAQAAYIGSPPPVAAVVAPEVENARALMGVSLTPLFGPLPPLSASVAGAVENARALATLSLTPTFGPLPTLSSSAAGAAENARARSDLYIAQNSWGQHISTQAVSAGASMTFTGLTAYLTYFLACSQVFPATNLSEVQVQLGENNPTTWNTTGNYTWENLALGSNSTTAANAVSTTDTGIAPAGGGTTNVLAQAVSFWGYLNDVTLSGANHGFTWTGRVRSANDFVANGSGYWSLDTNPITGVRVLAASGNISGKCSLYGLNQ